MCTLLSGLVRVREKSLFAVVNSWVWHAHRSPCWLLCMPDCRGGRGGVYIQLYIYLYTCIAQYGQMTWLANPLVYWLHPLTREYWSIYRGPGFLAVVCFGSSPTSFTPPPLSLRQLFSLSQSSCVAGRTLLTLRRRWGGEGMEEEPNHTMARKLVLYKQ
jgi:hypothetical protein